MIEGENIMSIKLENEWVEATFKEEGGEQTSFKLKSDQCEYLWQADPSQWGRHAPILFPIVGKLRDNQYILNLDTYTMPQHGFAKDSKFTMLEKRDNFVEFQLVSSEETMEQYPYSFQLKVRYELVENTINTTYIVKNLDSKIMYFSVGAHPGFNCPLVNGERFDDYYLEFSDDEEFNVRRLTKDFLVENELSPIPTIGRCLPLTDGLFSSGVYIFENLKSKSIVLKSKLNSKSLKMDFSGFEYFGIWTIANKPKYVCLEPWMGIADFENTDCQFTTKKGIRSLQPNENFSCSFRLTIS